jgi:hypothetical protein
VALKLVAADGFIGADGRPILYTCTLFMQISDSEVKRRITKSRRNNITDEKHNGKCHCTNRVLSLGPPVMADNPKQAARGTPFDGWVPTMEGVEPPAS